MNNLSDQQHRNRDIEFNAAADHADQVFASRVKALLAGGAELRVSEYTIPRFGTQFNYQYWAGGIGVRIGSDHFNNLTKVEGVSRVAYGVDGSGKYFEVWSKE